VKKPDAPPSMVPNALIRPSSFVRITSPVAGSMKASTTLSWVIVFTS
jgi:hypothetical protein